MLRKPFLAAGASDQSPALSGLGTNPGLSCVRSDTRKGIPLKRHPTGVMGGAVCVDPSDLMQHFPNDLPRTPGSGAVKMLHKKSLSSAQKTGENKG